MADMDNKITFERWEYPPIDKDVNEKERSSEKEAPSDEEQISVITEKENELEGLKQQLVEKEQKLSDEVELIKNLSEEIKSVYTSMTHEILNEGVELIKKITSKVIQKQFEIDNKLLQNEINNAIQLISSKENSCKLLVSSDDYPSIKAHFDSHSFITIKTDTSLTKGKFLFKTTHNEIEFDWEKRLNELFKV